MADLRTISSAEDARKEILTRGSGTVIENGEGDLFIDPVAKNGDTMSGLLRLTAGLNFNASGGDTLSDYEVGTWTPVVSGSSGSQGSFSADLVEGYYQRVGNICTATAGILNITDKGSWATFVFVSLPFKSKAVAIALPQGTVRIQRHSFDGQITVESFDSTNARFNINRSGQDRETLRWSDITTDTLNSIIFTLIYEIQ